MSKYFDGSSGTIFNKAKRSLTNSFDQLLKRKTKEDMDRVSPQPAIHQTSLPPRMGGHVEVDLGKLLPSLMQLLIFN